MRLLRNSLMLIVLLLAACSQPASPIESAAPPHAMHSPKPKPTRTLGPLVPLQRFDVSKHPEIAQALELIRSKVDIPVGLPPYLPAGLRLDRHGVYRFHSGHPGWMLVLDWPGHGELLFQFGASAFDGCGGDSAHPVEIRDQPGLVLTMGHDEASEVIWPATPEHQTGRYGIQGNLPTRQILRLARWMPALPGSGTESSC
jgi:hypothetical protein